MLFIRRNEAGRIVAVASEPPAAGDPAAAEWAVADDGDPEVIAFCDGISAQASALSRSDVGFIRVLEDVIDLLVARSVILFTDLPPAAQDKLMARRKARAGMRELSLLDDEGDDGLI